MGVDFKRVKHRVGKKLPRAQNQTDTSFKSQAISLAEQSVATDKAGLAVTGRNLTLKASACMACMHSVSAGGGFWWSMVVVWRNCLRGNHDCASAAAAAAAAAGCGWVLATMAQRPALALSLTTLLPAARCRTSWLNAGTIASACGGTRCRDWRNCSQSTQVRGAGPSGAVRKCSAAGSALPLPRSRPATLSPLLHPAANPPFPVLSFLITRRCRRCCRGAAAPHCAGGGGSGCTSG